MTLTTLVSGGSANAREAAIHTAVEEDLLRSGVHLNTALILEGLSDGKLATLPHELDIKRIAPGCFCCIGNLTLRVTLNRLLRKPPARLYISIADNTHLPQLRDFLCHAPYDALLQMTPDLVV
ncbi:GTPase [Collimonas silvisoli]|uniref:GTPase n=1 Tax=Collimonas silvisoli TaxID=2825884 RepID=UPI001B8D0339|nr:GTPase [Collimonas silvisoli]